MIKKLTAYSFILLANIVLLAHAVIPHHHHETDAIEPSQTYSSNAEKEHHHSFPEHEHQQDDYLFVIRQAFVLSTNPGRLLNNDDDCTGNNGLDYFFIQTLNILYDYIPPDDKIPIWDNPQKFIITVSCTFGSRAPPAIA